MGDEGRKRPLLRKHPTHTHWRSNIRMSETNRRSFLRAAGLAGVGAVVGGGAVAGISATSGTGKPQCGPATPANRHQHPKHSHLGVNWSVDTDKKLIALTFDDGPMPNWTPMTLDTLRTADVPATFFLVGQRVEKHAQL